MEQHCFEYFYLVFLNMFMAYHVHRLCTTIIKSHGKSMDTVQLLLGGLSFTSTSIPIMSSSIYCANSWQNCNIDIISPCSKWPQKKDVFALDTANIQAKCISYQTLLPKLSLLNLEGARIFVIINFMEMFRV